MSFFPAVISDRITVRFSVVSLGLLVTASSACFGERHEFVDGFSVVLPTEDGALETKASVPVEDVVYDDNPDLWRDFRIEYVLKNPSSTRPVAGELSVSFKGGDPEGQHPGERIITIALDPEESTSDSTYITDEPPFAHALLFELQATNEIRGEIEVRVDFW